MNQYQILLLDYPCGHDQNQGCIIEPRSPHYYCLALTDLYVAMNSGFASGNRQGKIKPAKLNLESAGRARAESDRTCVKHVGSNSSYSSSRGRGRRPANLSRALTLNIAASFASTVPCALNDRSHQIVFLVVQRLLQFGNRVFQVRRVLDRKSVV